jgi:hypothetical protein
MDVTDGREKSTESIRPETQDDSNQAAKAASGQAVAADEEADEVGWRSA